MPHLSVKLYAGKSEAEKQALAAALAEAVKRTLGSTDASISIAVEDIAPADWAETVYRPEILERPELIYKPPGYNPFG